MNKIYKVIWSKAKHCYVVASEIAKSHSKSGSATGMKKLLLATLAAATLSCTGFSTVDAVWVKASDNEYYNVQSVNDAVKTDEKVSQNKSDIAALTSDVSELQDTVATRASKTDVETLSVKVGDEGGGLVKQVNDLSTELKERTGTLDKAVKNTEMAINNVATNLETAINNVATNLEGVQKNLETNLKSVETAVTNEINKANRKIGTNEGNINKNKSDIATLTSDVSELQETVETKASQNEVNALKTKTNEISYTAGTGTTISGVTINGGAMIDVTSINGTEIGTKQSGTYIKQDGSIWGNLVEVDKAANSNADAIKDVKENVIGTVAEGTYVHTTNNVAQNLNSLDTQLKINTVGFATVTEKIEGIDRTENIDSTNNTVIKDKLIANNDATFKQSVTVDGKTTTKNLDVKENASIGGTLEVTGKAIFKGGIDANGEKITKVGDGRIAEDSTDAVNGRQLYTEQQERIDADSALSERISTLARDGEYIKQVNTVSGNLRALDDGLIAEKAAREEADTAEAIARKDADSALSERISTLARDGEYIKQVNTVSGNLRALDDGLIAEKAAREEADTAEAIARKDADSTLSDRIGSQWEDGSYIKASADTVNGYSSVYDNLRSLDTALKETDDRTGGITRKEAVTQIEGQVTVDREGNISDVKKLSAESIETTGGADIGGGLTVKGESIFGDKATFNNGIDVSVGKTSLRVEEGTIKNDATETITNTAGTSITDKVSKNTRVLDTEGITDTVGDTSFKQRIEKILMNAGENSGLAIEKEAINIDSEEIIGTATDKLINQVKNGDEVMASIAMDENGDVKTAAKKNITNEAEGDIHSIAKNITNTAEETLTHKAKDIVNEASGSVTTAVKVRGEEMAGTEMDANGNINTTAKKTITTSARKLINKAAEKITDTVGDDENYNTVESTADGGTTFKNSEANTAITAEDKTGTATTTTIKGNRISTGKATMDFAEVLKDLGVRGDAKVDGKTTTGTLEVEGESQLKGNTTIGTAEKNANLTVNGNSTVSGNQTIGGTLDVTGISTFHDNVTMDKNLTVGGEVKAQSLNIADTVKISKDGIDAGGTKMYNVADGELASGSRDAVNGGQLYRVKQDLETQVEKVGANAAAMANLHPMDFDPDAKWNVAGALGNYGSETAAALGVFYRPNEDVMVNMSTAFGTGENMVGGGVSVRLGKGGRSKVTRAENDALKAQVDSLTARMDALLSVLNPNMSRDFPDVPENHWAYEAVSRLAGNGIVEGYPDGNFHGERTMSRYEMAEIIYNALSQGAEAEAELVEEFKPELQAMAASKQASAEDAVK